MGPKQFPTGSAVPSPVAGPQSVLNEIPTDSLKLGHVLIF